MKDDLKISWSIDDAGARGVARAHFVWTKDGDVISVENYTRDQLEQEIERRRLYGAIVPDAFLDALEALKEPGY